MNIAHYLKSQKIIETYPDLQGIAEQLVRSCQQISEYLNKRIDQELTPPPKSHNIHGEPQKSADIIANNLFLKNLQNSSALTWAISEENDTLYKFDHTQCDFVVAFDPLDGSSNVDINMTVGSIFGVWKKMKTTPNGYEINGRDLLLAGFASYGPQTALILTCGEGVAEFVWHEGDWLLIHDKLRIPRNCQEFAINASNFRHWQVEVQHQYLSWLDGAAGFQGKDYNMRWTASMVADVHRILRRGGIFLYPWDQRNPKQAGKLRLVYEGFPMAMIVEQADGMAITESSPILDLIAHHIHQKTSVILGSKNEVARLQKMLVPPLD
ncbi:MAG: class 1 fructose-bisphosphatase [Gammaproteobacteria bacterium]|nr:class 1 fructose-bisphosphatase [Gammaproteobacteria bacterium]